MWEKKMVAVIQNPYQRCFQKRLFTAELLYFLFWDILLE